MRAQVVYESIGNTAEVANTVSEGMAREMDVDLHEVSDAPAPAAATGFVVLGGPTRAYSLTRPSTRADAVRQGAPTDRATVGLLPLGYTPVARESFSVADVADSLLQGELDRARQWGHDLAADMRARHDGRAPSRRP
jgi:hypothetical protein